jgi:hypothetical protein
MKIGKYQGKGEGFSTQLPIQSQLPSTQIFRDPDPEPQVPIEELLSPKVLSEMRDVLKYDWLMTERN